MKFGTKKNKGNDCSYVDRKTKEKYFIRIQISNLKIIKI